MPVQRAADSDPCGKAAEGVLAIFFREIFSAVEATDEPLVEVFGSLLDVVRNGFLFLAGNAGFSASFFRL